MTLSPRAKIFILAAGDLAALYASLVGALYLRYGAHWQRELIERHLAPFSIIFVIWIAIFYVAGLYDLRRLRNNLEFLKILGLTVAVNAALAIMFFYLVPIFGITPKTNLFIFLAIFAVVAVFWRRAFNRWTELSQPLSHITLVGESEAMRELDDFLRQTPQLGFRVHQWIKEGSLADSDEGICTIRASMEEGPSDILVVPRDLKRDPRLAKALYELFARGVAVHDIPSFYEEVFRKIPTAEISEEWVLEHLTNHHRFYDGLKRAFEAVASLGLLIVLSPLLVLIALLVKLTSRGPAIYAQTRVGKNGRFFTLYKFRSMRADAEQHGAQWAPAAHDPRSTPIGHFLRATHLDELPQLANIMAGDLSFVGPRPERPEFVERLRTEVPYYDVRLLVQPGVTGWAQLHHRKDQTTDDVVEKLTYDMYYIKNRSIVIDLAIILKTLKTLFVTPQ